MSITWTERGQSEGNFLSKSDCYETYRLGEDLLPGEDVRLVSPLPVHHNPVNVWRTDLCQPAGVEVTAESEENSQSVHQVGLSQQAAASLARLRLRLEGGREVGGGASRQGGLHLRHQQRGRSLLGHFPSFTLLSLLPSDFLLFVSLLLLLFLLFFLLFLPFLRGLHCRGLSFNQLVGQ